MQRYEKKMKCEFCGKHHDKARPHYTSANRISDKGFPTHSKKYNEAHKEANKEEKQKFGEKAFKEMEKIDSKLEKHELAGKNTRTGKIEVSYKVPKKFREQVAYHEKVENKILRKKK
jgi:hypothetical protein